MIDAELDALEAVAKAATPGPWTWNGSLSVDANDFDLCSCVDWRSPINRNGMANARYIAAANPAVVIDLISQIRACHELIEVLTKAGMMAESVAFTRSCFNHSAYAEICRNIPELRQKAGLPPIGGRND